MDNHENKLKWYVFEHSFSFDSILKCLLSGLLKALKSFDPLKNKLEVKDAYDINMVSQNSS